MICFVFILGPNRYLVHVHRVLYAIIPQTSYIIQLCAFDCAMCVCVYMSIVDWMHDGDMAYCIDSIKYNFRCEIQLFYAYQIQYTITNTLQQTHTRTHMCPICGVRNSNILYRVFCVVVFSCAILHIAYHVRVDRWCECAMPSTDMAIEMESSLLCVCVCIWKVVSCQVNGPSH